MNNKITMEEAYKQVQGAVLTEAVNRKKYQKAAKQLADIAKVLDKGTKELGIDDYMADDYIAIKDLVEYAGELAKMFGDDEYWDDIGR